MKKIYRTIKAGKLMHLNCIAFNGGLEYVYGIERRKDFIRIDLSNGMKTFYHRDENVYVVEAAA